MHVVLQVDKPLLFFAELFGLSATVWVLGAVIEVALLPALPLSALTFLFLVQPRFT